jgi:carbonic anhydrase/SulP family sulfate permease
LDARRTDYIDPDILSLIREFKDVTAPAHNIQVGQLGFRNKYKFADSVETGEFAPTALREHMTHDEILQVLKAGNTRFFEGHPLDRDLRRRADSDGTAPPPMAAFLTGIDARSPIEMIFDLGIGDAYVLRFPGATVGPRAIGGLEFAVAEGTKLIVVIGHTRSRFVELSLARAANRRTEGSAEEHSSHFNSILDEIDPSIEATDIDCFRRCGYRESMELVDKVARAHVVRSVRELLVRSPILQRHVDDGSLALIGAMYDVDNGKVEFLSETLVGCEHATALGNST